MTEEVEEEEVAEKNIFCLLSVKTERVGDTSPVREGC